MVCVFKTTRVHLRRISQKRKVMIGSYSKAFISVCVQHISQNALLHHSSFNGLLMHDRGHSPLMSSCEWIMICFTNHRCEGLCAGRQKKKKETNAGIRASFINLKYFNRRKPKCVLMIRMWIIRQIKTKRHYFNKRK